MVAEGDSNVPLCFLLMENLLPPNDQPLSDADRAKLVQRLMVDWSKMMQARLESQAARMKLKLTGELQKSINFKLLEAQTIIRNELDLYFAEQGRLRDMKVRYLGKMPPIGVMLKYVREVGVDNFRYVPGYPPGVRPTGPSKNPLAQGYTIAEAKIAYGISHSRTLRTPKRKAWFNKTFYGGLPSLEADLSKVLQDFAANSVQAISSGVKM